MNDRLAASRADGRERVQRQNGEDRAKPLNQHWLRKATRGLDTPESRISARLLCALFVGAHYCQIPRHLKDRDRPDDLKHIEVES